MCLTLGVCVCVVLCCLACGCVCMCAFVCSSCFFDRQCNRWWYWTVRKHDVSFKVRSSCFPCFHSFDVFFLCLFLHFLACFRKSLLSLSLSSPPSHSSIFTSRAIVCGLFLLLICLHSAAASVRVVTGVSQESNLG